MITDKDKEEAVNVISAYLGGGTEAVEKELSIYRTELAEQVRKETAERAVAFLKKEWYWFNDDACYADELRTAILDDSTTDHIPDTGEKLAIAVKALEDIKKIGKAGPAFETHFSKLQYIGAVTNDALKEIQG